MTDPKAFWTSLDPAYAISLIDAAPRVAGPWKQPFHNHLWTRQHGARVQERRPGKYSAEVQVDSNIEMRHLNLDLFDSPEAARDACDEWLLENGWLLR